MGKCEIFKFLKYRLSIHQSMENIMLIPRIYTFNSISFCLGDKFILVKVFDAESMCKIITTHLPKKTKIQPWCFLNCDETSHSLSKVIYYGN